MSTVRFYTNSFSVYNVYIYSQMALMPEALQGGVQCTPEQTIGFNAWHWLKAQEVDFIL